jgi:energy-coupling factor transporter transmembrane protein EcfT
MRHFLRAGSLSLLAACLLPIFGAVVISTPQVGVITLALELVGLGWWASDPRASARRLLLGLLAGISIAISTWLYGGQDLAAASAACLRILVIVLPSAMLTPVIEPSELGDHLAQRLRLPARPVVAAVIGLQRVDEIGEQWSQVQRARRARGLGMDGGVMRRLEGSARSAFALLVLSMRQTGATSLAMDARGFAAAKSGRTWARGAPWLAGDSVVLVVALVIAVLPWLLR